VGVILYIVRQINIGLKVNCKAFWLSVEKIEQSTRGGYAATHNTRRDGPLGSLYERNPAL